MVSTNKKGMQSMTDLEKKIEAMEQRLTDIADGVRVLGAIVNTMTEQIENLNIMTNVNAQIPGRVSELLWHHVAECHPERMPTTVQ
jgi:hypothetical protein